MANQIKKLTDYLLSKKDEVKDLQTRDALLAKVVLDIHRKRTNSEFVIVPLFSLKQIHDIDREGAIIKTNTRAEELSQVKQELLKEKTITREILAKYLPSVSWIKVVKEKENSYISYEGNGRVVALQKVFSPGDDISVEVEEYYFRDTEKIIRRMNRVRKLNGLI